MALEVARRLAFEGRQDQKLSCADEMPAGRGYPSLVHGIGLTMQ